MNYVSSTVIGSNLKTRTVLPFPKNNKCTNSGYQFDTRECIEMPPIFDSTIISCKCSRNLCDLLEIPENETPKKHQRDLKEKISKTHDISHDVVEEISSESNQSNSVLFEKTNHNKCNDLSKFGEIECIEQIPMKRAKYFECGFQSKSRKRKIPCFKTKQLKKTKY